MVEWWSRLPLPVPRAQCEVPHFFLIKYTQFLNVIIVKTINLSEYLNITISTDVATAL